MTSANTVDYTIRHNKKEVGRYRQNFLCKPRWHELLKFTPYEEHTIQAWGYDEEEEYWEDEPQSLKEFLIKTKIINPE